MKIKFLTLIVLLLSSSAFAQQNTVDIKMCRDSAKVNWPNFKKSELYQREKNLLVKNLGKNYLPKLNFSLNATYQSEVVDFGATSPAGALLPDLPLDNYNAELSVNQIIYDGGSTSKMKDLQSASTEMELIKEDISNYDLMWQINSIYLNILLLKSNGDILVKSEELLEKNIASMRASVKSGVVLDSELNKLLSEKLKLDKKIIENKYSVEKLTQSLQLISGLEINDSTHFAMPMQAISQNKETPLIKSFDQQILLSDKSLEIENRSRYPKLSLFARGGYGRPGFNFADTELHTYGIVGLKLSWDFLDWGIYSNKKETTQVKKLNIEANKENYLLKNKIEIDKCDSDIQSLEEQILKDKEIISLYDGILQSAQSKLKNGTITSNEYLEDFNQLHNSYQLLLIDQIKLIQARMMKEHLIGVEY